MPTRSEMQRQILDVYKTRVYDVAYALNITTYRGQEYVMRVFLDSIARARDNAGSSWGPVQTIGRRKVNYSDHQAALIFDELESLAGRGGAGQNLRQCIGGVDVLQEARQKLGV